MPHRIASAADLGRIAAEKRKLDGLTQADLAGYCGVGERFVGELERGKPTVRLDKALQVLEGLGLELTVKARGE
ncbi:helix-turn-helix domain-containing protein [Desulfonatronum thioautotrophicum]|uniref:helix-turn-helix domain-containing protein n=1 Tax=Desulfonatronum thioautotrophicum TaxID=617001 RepID=UPI0005EBEA9F|nr:helix-turn-helix domain-containing protein [Desulfonatronum thioautotrophicum]